MTARTVPQASAVSALEAYERWAATYAPEPHNPLMAAEQRTMLALLPDVVSRRVLDLACGTGRYARLAAAAHAASVVALDLSPAMLQRAAIAGLRVQASMDRLPLVDACFDIVISGLALGHAPDLDRWMREVARVLAPGGTLLYSDFHPAAAERGLRRTFRDGSQQVHEVAHCCHAVEAQRDAAIGAGLAVEHVVELRAGIEFVETFDGADAFYRREHGTPLVLVVRARKVPYRGRQRCADADTRDDVARDTPSPTSPDRRTDAGAADDSARDLSRRAVRDMDVAAGAPRDGFTASRRGRCRAGSRPLHQILAAFVR